ncbi:MAG: ABC transporter substrate-binding protein [Candidatus Binatia bacterium]
MKIATEKIFFLAVCSLLFSFSFSAEAQQPIKVLKIGWFGAGVGDGPGTESFRRELHGLGYIEGKNFVIEYRYARNNLARLSILADELVGSKVDVLITSSSASALALKNATRTIPIIFYSVADPVATGLIDSLARPGGNVTGFTIVGTQLAGKRLELLKEIVPKLSRVAVLWNPDEPGSAQEWKESQLPARELGVKLFSLEVSSPEKYESGFKNAINGYSEALTVPGSSLAVSNRKRIVKLAEKNRLPAIFDRRDFVDGGGLMSYGTDRNEQYRRIAWMVDKIHKGTKPADLPVEQPTKFELVLNLKTAKQIGLTIPPNVLARADRVIK